MTTLGDIAEMTFGFAFKSADFTDDPTGIRLLRGDNVVQGRLRWAAVKRYPSKLSDDFGKYLLAPGDVVLAMDRPWIEAGLKFAVIREADSPSLLVQRVARLRAKKSLLHQGFLGYLIGSQSFTEHVLSVQTGSAVPHISGKQIAEFEIESLPPIPEQRGIAATLGALDDKIESNRQASEVASSLLDALAAEAALVLPQVRLGDFVERGKETANPVRLGTQRVDHYSLPAFDQRGLPEHVLAAEIMSNKLIVPGRSILLSRLNPRINRTWWVTPHTGVLALASTEFLCIRARTDEDLAAAWLAVRTEEFLTELPQRVTGTSGSHQRVGPEDVLDIKVPDMSRTPLETKQAALALLERREQLNTESAGVAALRDALLPELLSGRIRVPEANK